FFFSACGAAIAVLLLVWLSSHSRRIPAADALVALALMIAFRFAPPPAVWKRFDTTCSGKSEDLFDEFTTSPAAKAKPVAAVLFKDDYFPPGEYYYFREATFSLAARWMVRTTRSRRCWRRYCKINELQPLI